MDLGQTDQSLSKSAETSRFPGERFEGWVGSVGAKRPAVFQFLSSENYVPRARSLLRSPEGAVLAPWPASRPPIHSHSYARPCTLEPPRLHSRDHTAGRLGVTEATGKCPQLCIGAHFSLSNYLPMVAFRLTDVSQQTHPDAPHPDARTPTEP